LSIKVLLWNLEGLETKACLLLTHVAEGFAVLILSTLVTKFKVKGKDVLLIGVQINFIGDILLTEKVVCAASSTLEAVRTFPAAFGHLN
jgi:hypothetical protein